MMKPDSLIELITTRNFETAEKEWMRVFEASDVESAALAAYDKVLAALCEADRASQAEELAWAGIEALIARTSPRQAIPAAGAFLLAIGDSEELRAQVVSLFEQAYAEREGLSKLLEEAGLAGGRPVRRALRTLDVCLSLNDDDYLVARDEDDAARVVRVDPSTWDVTLTTNRGEEKLGAVHLADRYRPAPPTEFRVMRQFRPDELIERMWKDPIPVLVDICTHNGNRVDSDTLERIFVPELLPEGDWKKWWTKARGAIRRSPHFTIEGRSPCDVIYADKPISLEDDLLAGFEHLHDPFRAMAHFESYLGDCKARQETPDAEVAQKCHERVAARAARLAGNGAVQAGLWWVLARYMARVGGLEARDDRILAFFKTSDDLKGVFLEIQNDTLLDLACDTVIEARPDGWKDDLAGLLPILPTAVCDKAATRLIEAGATRDSLEPVVQEILAFPVAHFEALLWLWDGPTRAESIPVPPAVTILSRVLKGLAESRRSEMVPKEHSRRLGARARQVFSARRYKRFDECIEDIDPGMAHALHTQVRQLDLLGVSVHEKLLSRLRAKFPTEKAATETPPWQREEVLYVTETGMSRKRTEIDHHVNVKMRENAKAIGRAAAHGDLSENSEYKFALEERDLLRARLAQMNEEMAAAHVLDPDEVPTDHVGIGAEIRLRRVADSEPYKLAILGPWEADSEKNCYNYKTPLAQKLLGKRVGDTVEFEHTGATGTYEIVSISNVLAPES
ncbi:MAG: GreA/GreB family elongation factor [Phycisphaerae bacterium]|jgi:transcription elongation GreA/GreB family factor